MAFVIAVVLAILVLPTPWNLVIVIAGAAGLVTVIGGMWWSQRRSVRVGAETLIGREATVRATCAPVGNVSLRGELWRARSAEPARAGTAVRVVGIDGLTLVVEPVTPEPAGPRDRAAR